MKKTILALALAVGITSFAGNAKADTFYNWSFTGNASGSSTYNDTLSGLLTLNEYGQATSVTITNESGGRPFESINYAAVASQNSFTIGIGGAITSYNFRADNSVSYGYGQGTSSALYFGNPTLGNYYGYVQSGLYGSPIADYRVANTDIGTTFTYVSGPIPEPSTYALFGIGVIGLLMVMRRKKTA